MTLEDFKAQFAFDPKNAGKVGVERECFLVDTNGTFVPRASEVLSCLQEKYRDGTFTYELSACQLEKRVGPILITSAHSKMSLMQREMDAVLAQFGLRSCYREVGPDDMPLDIYPDPRYAEIARNRNRADILAACRVIATHVHIGMPDHATALHVYNRVRSKIPSLCMLGDHSNGKRLEIYRSVAPDWNPPHLRDWESFHQFAETSGFIHDLRRWWALIRISRHGTIEFRMFGATESIDEVMYWVKTCRDMCLAS